MNPTELGELVLGGRLILVGDLRACRVENAGWVDGRLGRSSFRPRITYIVERQRPWGVEIVKISRLCVPPHPDPEVIIGNLHSGLRYAFECSTVKKDRAGLVVATMEAEAPIPLNEP